MLLHDIVWIERVGENKRKRFCQPPPAVDRWILDAPTLDLDVAGAATTMTSSTTLLLSITALQFGAAVVRNYCSSIQESRRTPSPHCEMAAAAQVFFCNLHPQWILDRRAIQGDSALMMEVVPNLKIRRRRRRSLSANADWRRARSSTREWSSSGRRQRNWLIDQNPRGSSRRRRRCCCCCCFRGEFGWQEDATDGTSGLFLQPRIHARSVEDVAADGQLTKHLGRCILH